ncbi:MAG: LacI family transcriptional regulator, partial [Anaerolineales bacterium]
MKGLKSLFFAILIAVLLFSCAGPTTVPEEEAPPEMIEAPEEAAPVEEAAPEEFTVVVIGKSVHPYWS